jgi:hypothetical protein
MTPIGPYRKDYLAKVEIGFHPDIGGGVSGMKVIEFEES